MLSIQSRRHRPAAVSIGFLASLSAMPSDDSFGRSCQPFWSKERDASILLVGLVTVGVFSGLQALEHSAGVEKAPTIVSRRCIHACVSLSDGRFGSALQCCASSVRVRRVTSDA